VPAALADLDKPNAVFVGGGLDAATFDCLWSLMPARGRIAAHSVTLETEALLSELQNRHGGDMMRIEISHAAPLGSRRSWTASRPVVQWHAVKGEGA
jgi:precorrin-6Y C5,15-methyltransferase (decarboxylating)